MLAGSILIAELSLGQGNDEIVDRRHVLEVQSQTGLFDSVRILVIAQVGQGEHSFGFGMLELGVSVGMLGVVEGLLDIHMPVQFQAQVCPHYPGLHVFTATMNGVGYVLDSVVLLQVEFKNCQVSPRICLPPVLLQTSEIGAMGEPRLGLLKITGYCVQRTKVAPGSVDTRFELQGPFQHRDGFRIPLQSSKGHTLIPKRLDILGVDLEDSPAQPVSLFENPFSGLVRHCLVALQFQPRKSQHCPDMIRVDLEGLTPLLLGFIPACQSCKGHAAFAESLNLCLASV